MTITVFVNERPVGVAPGATARDAVTAAGLEPGAGLRITDARGLPVDPAAPLAAGSILRAARSARRPADGHA